MPDRLNNLVDTTMGALFVAPWLVMYSVLDLFSNPTEGR